MSLTTAKVTGYGWKTMDIPGSRVKDRIVNLVEKGRKPRSRKLNPKQKQFCENLIKTGGQKQAAYQMTYGVSDSKYPQAQAYKLAKDPLVVEHTNQLLDKYGLPKDFLVKKLKDLCDAKNDKGNNDNSTQLSSVKLGMELHGMIQKNVEQPNLTINYNLDNNSLSSALHKLNELTKKLELQECPSGIIDAEVIG